AGACAAAPPLSVTVSVRLNVPLAAYVCVVVATEVLELVPSPQFHTYAVIVPVGFWEPLAFTLTGALTVPVYGPPGFATGATVSIEEGVSPLAPYAIT